MSNGDDEHPNRAAMRAQASREARSGGPLPVFQIPQTCRCADIAGEMIQVAAMDGLIAFLNARLDEDEAAARSAARKHRPPWRAETWADGLKGSVNNSPEGASPSAHDSGFVADTNSGAVASHIARYDPARALREVAAKRAILAEHGLANGGRDAGRCRVCTAITHTGMGHADARRFRAPCPTLLFLAAVYSDHADYRQEWAPQSVP